MNVSEKGLRTDANIISPFDFCQRYLQNGSELNDVLGLYLTFIKSHRHEDGPSNIQGLLQLIIYIIRNYHSNATVAGGLEDMEREEYWEGRVLKTPFTFPSSTTRKMSSIDLMELSDSDQMILPLTANEPSILITLHHH